MWHYFNYWEDATSAHVSALSYRTVKTRLFILTRTKKLPRIGRPVEQPWNIKISPAGISVFVPLIFLTLAEGRRTRLSNILISWEVTWSHTTHSADSLRIFLWVFCLLETIYSNTVESGFVKRRTIFVYWCWLYIVLYFKLEFPLTGTKLSQSQLNKHSNCKEETQLSYC